MASLRALDNNISITICGDGGCGKSALALRIVRQEYVSEYDPTVEDSYNVSRTFDGQPHQLYIRDTAGQLEYRSEFQPVVTPGPDAYLLVYDVTSPASLETLTHDFWPQIEKDMKMRATKGAMQPYIMVVGNKVDLAQKRRVKAIMGLNWAKKRNCGFMETSASENVNVDDTFLLIVRRVTEARRHHAAARIQSPPPNVSSQAFLPTAAPQASTSTMATTITTGTSSTVDEKKDTNTDHEPPTRRPADFDGWDDKGEATSTSNSHPQSQSQIQKKKRDEDQDQRLGFFARLRCW